MASDSPGLSDLTGLLFDLQRANEIAQRLSGCLELGAIARCVTDGLVEKFDCAFARIWVVESDRTALKLVASSGLYTRLDGSFSRVPMGAFKVGKIAQHCIPFLSNQLAEESWVKDRDWAIRHQICGFAGYPLMVQGKVTGVLVTFSRQPMAAEFLQVLQGLCTTVAVSLENALHYQKQLSEYRLQSAPALSEQLANILHTRLVLVGTEQSLVPSLAYLFLHVAERLNTVQCSYCRLNYGADYISLEAMATPGARGQKDWSNLLFGDVILLVSCLGGSLRTYSDPDQDVVQVVLRMPYPASSLGPQVRVHCQSSVLQLAFTQLAYQAGLTVVSEEAVGIPLITDTLTHQQRLEQTLYITPEEQSLPEVGARLGLSVSPVQLRSAVEAVIEGKTWGIEIPGQKLPNPLTESEQKILTLLAQGLRDREIAGKLCVSESTVKFHVRNILAKSGARTRFHALYLALSKRRLRL